MLTFGKLMGRNRNMEGGSKVKNKADKPIIHESVPDEVLYPDGKDEFVADTSWLDTIPSKKAPSSSSSPVETSSPAASVKVSEPKVKASDADIPNPPASVRMSDKANTVASARPRFPCGWLVVVEGPGVGEWFVLERGVTHIGSGEGQTVHLDFGDTSVAPQQHAALAYDDDRQLFVLEGALDASVRVNGVPQEAALTLRDGDVVSLGRTSLRLVALCSPNFHWASELIDV